MDSPSRDQRPANKEEERYWICRKSLRLRPLGRGNDQAAVTDYMKEHLKIDSTTIETIGSFTVQRIPVGPGSKIKDEAIVTFQ